MSKRRFRIEFASEAVIELDDAVISAVDNEWRSIFYDLYTAYDIAEHIAYNLVINHARLSMLNGWADQPDSYARIIEKPDWDVFAGAPAYCNGCPYEDTDSSCTWDWGEGVAPPDGKCFPME